MKKVNYVALILSALIAISVFLPWVEASSSVDAGIFGSSSFSTGGFSGIQFSEGIFGLLLAIAGGVMAFKNIRWAFIVGILNFINGLAYMLGWFNSEGSGSYSFSFGSSSYSSSYSSSIDPLFGLYFFVICSLLFTVFTLKNVKKDRVKEENEIAFCPNCGSKVEKGVKFCQECGNEVV